VTFFETQCRGAHWNVATLDVERNHAN